jgi:hypothetical protein
VLIVDDLIASGGTVLRATAAGRAAGARHIDVAACHGVFTPAAQALLGQAGPDTVLVTDTVPLPQGFAASDSFGTGKNGLGPGHKTSLKLFRVNSLKQTAKSVMSRQSVFQ